MPIDPVAVAEAAFLRLENMANEIEASSEQVAALLAFVTLFMVKAQPEVLRLQADALFLEEIRRAEDPLATVLVFASDIAEESISDFIGFMTQQKKTGS